MSCLATLACAAACLVPVRSSCTTISAKATPISMVTMPGTINAQRQPKYWPITPVTSGRLRVRCMTASMSRSMTMLIAFAPPAASVPPTTVATTSHVAGQPRRATIIVGTVVTSRSSMMRGLVSATKAAARLRGAESARGSVIAGRAMCQRG